MHAFEERPETPELGDVTSALQALLSEVEQLASQLGDGVTSRRAARSRRLLVEVARLRETAEARTVLDQLKQRQPGDAPDGAAVTGGAPLRETS
jgi:uncharacterized membrane protein YccC